jgi:organic hydroperoxide reductase OsmC/OhrA
MMRMKGEHHYRARLAWKGDHTTDYATYDRGHRVTIEGKPPLDLTADPAFRGSADTLNPEDLFVSALASCHMLSYLALCAKYRINVLAYDDEASGIMLEDGRGGGRFTEVVLRPRVTIADPSQIERASELHERAHELCFIASSVSIPVRHEAEVRA